MIHQLIFAAPKPGMTEQQFQDYWVNNHAVNYASKIPQIKRYAVDTRIAQPDDDGEPLWSGVAEIWLENEEDQLASLQTPEFLEGARLDEPKWAAFWRTVVLDTDTEVMRAGEAERADEQGVKLLVLAKRREGLSVADFRRHSREVHGPMVLNVPGVRRYYQSYTRDSWYSISEPSFDVAYHVWFDSVEAMREARQSPEQAKVLADYDDFVNTRYLHALLVRMNWVIGPEPR
jgi:uncharacterized protein (TIGR02118 family)